MNANKKRAALLVAAISFSSLMSVGCWDGLLQNIWKGFGYGIGGLPADIVNTYISGFIDPFLNPDANANDNAEG